MSKPVAYRFKSPLSEEGQWEYGKEPPVGSRWEIEGLYRVQVNVPRTPLEKAAKDVLQLVDYMLRNGEWYQAQERADALRAALAQPDQRTALEQPEQPEQPAEPVLLQCTTCGTVYDEGVPPVVPVAWVHKETGLLRREISGPKGADWDANYWQPLYATAQPTAEDIAQEWDLLKETQAALRDAWAILKKLKAVQDAARELVESDPDSAADTEGEAFAAWCALVAAIDDADTLLCEFGESHE